MNDKPTERNGCPAWCRSRVPNHQTHLGKGETVRASASNFPVLTVTPERTGLGTVHVLVIRHDLATERCASVFVEPGDAEKWATILDAAGCADLATALRRAVAEIAAAVAVIARDGGQP